GSGTSWSVVLNGVTATSTSTSIAFAEPNGTYTFSIPVVSGFIASPSSGSVTVSGAARTVSIQFATAVYTVTFTETGLPAGASWTVTLNGVAEIGTGTQITFSMANGTYAYTVSGPHGYSTNPSQGSVRVAGSAVSVPIACQAVTYAIVFTQSGLPSGTSWSVTLGGVLQTSTGRTIAFTETNGTYTFSVGAIASYTISPTNGTAVVSGAALAYTIHFSALFPLQFHQSGLLPGSTWSVTVAGHTVTGTTSTLSFAVTNGSYAYSVAAITGYLIAPSSGTLQVSGTGATVSIQFQPIYTITFTETGLPSGTTWKVTVNTNTVLTGSGTTLAVSGLNGLYSYTVAAVGGYVPSPASGVVVLTGSSTTVTISFHPVTYSVTMTETGLPSGTSWSAILNGVTQSSSTSSIVFAVANGTYSYTINAVSGFTPSPASGSVTVVGASRTVSVTFSHMVYSVVFTEVGLPFGTSWSVTLGGVLESSVSTRISFSEPNGSSPFVVTTLAKYTPTPSSGTVTVHGSSLSVAILFSLASTPFSFTKMGARAGPNSATSLGSVTYDSGAGRAIPFTLGAAEFPRVVVAEPGSTATPASGSIHSMGHPVSGLIAFSATSAASSPSPVPSRALPLVSGVATNGGFARNAPLTNQILARYGPSISRESNENFVIWVGG
ncbi:MAG: hypothetical protein ABSA15_06685, partial [Thermoplasmata archaeon]